MKKRTKTRKIYLYDTTFQKLNGIHKASGSIKRKISLFIHQGTRM